MSGDENSGLYAKEEPGFFGEVIHAYTRADALADGYLVDVTEVARTTGFRFPVALTRTVWDDCVAWTEEDATVTGHAQDEQGRLRDVLWMTYLAARAMPRDGDRVPVTLYRVRNGADAAGRGEPPRLVTVQAIVGPGDAGEPVITILFPGEE